MGFRHPVELLERIDAELLTGRSQKDIAKEFGVCTRTVHRIKKGQVDFAKRYNSQYSREIWKQDMVLFVRPYSRCSSCGSKVQKPCLYCALKSGNMDILEPILIRGE